MSWILHKKWSSFKHYYFNPFASYGPEIFNEFPLLVNLWKFIELNQFLSTFATWRQKKEEIIGLLTTCIAPDDFFEETVPEMQEY